MTARLFDFEAERMRRRPYADEGSESLHTLALAAVNNNQTGMLELITAEIKYRQRLDVKYVTPTGGTL